jgi:purine-nucleoside/S-methyl-5'-thioadenosine phosphorylase / adenosine deaminase
MAMRTEIHGDGEGWDLPLLRSALIAAPFVHGFSTRAGGVSTAPFDTLNLGARWGDVAASVEENRRRLLRAAGVPGPLYVVRQVHGAGVARVRAGDDPAAVARLEADALVTGDPGVTLGVFVADCIPALIVDARTGAVAAAHAGWRGTVAGVLPAVVRAMADEFGTRPDDLRVVLGPAIGPCCFEVGAEVIAAFAGALGGAADAGVVTASPRDVAGKWHVDLNAANRLLLERAGVRPDAIDAAPACTSCDRAHFFSYRRDHDRTGQQMGVVARPSP